MQKYGFTLLEVLVTMTLVIVGLILISQGFSAGLRAVRISDRATMAKFLLEEKIAESELELFSSHVSDEGDFGPEYPGYGWIKEVRPTELSNLIEIELRVFWRENNQYREIKINKLIADRGTEFIL